MNWRSVLAEAAGLVVAAAVFGGLANQFRAESRKLSWQPAPRSESPALPPEGRIARDPAALYTVVPGELAGPMHRAGILFIDARRSDAYALGHIPGARSIPVWESDADARIEGLKRDGVRHDEEIVVYCTGPDCEDSARLAEKLALAGFFRISVYREGFPDWKKRGWPVSEGDGR